MFPVSSIWRAAVVAAAMAALGAQAHAADAIQLEAPGLTLDRNGALVCPQGVVATFGDRHLMADQARVDQEHDDIYARGHVVLLIPGMRVAADRLGLHPQARTGHAWNVDVDIATADRTIHAHAAEAELEPRRLVLHDVAADLGHGALAGIRSGTIVILLYDERRQADRSGAKEYVAGIETYSTTITLGGVPVLWLPYLYRDFSLDYPWSYVAVGHTRRLGEYVHYWVGSNLPVFDGWHTRLEARGDDNTRAGMGFGANVFWRHDWWGHGEFQYFEMPKEKVMGGPLAGGQADDREGVGDRRARLFDVEHQADLGSGAAYLRYTQEPGADPIAHDGAPDPAGGDERFRGDFMGRDLDRRPLARQGGAVAYGVPFGTLVVDTWHRPMKDLDFAPGSGAGTTVPAGPTERWLGVQGLMNPIDLVGPVHLRAEAWEEDLRRTHDDTSADRLRGNATLGGTRWLGGELAGIGLDAAAGPDTLRYDQGRILGTPQPLVRERTVGHATAGVSVRLAAAGDGWTHVLTPRLGVDWTTAGVGDTLPSYHFGDVRDRFEEDRRYYVAGFETTWNRQGRTLRARATARFAMRDQDRLFIDDSVSPTVVWRGRSRLADIDTLVSGDLTDDLSLNATATYDDRPRRFQQFYTAATYRIDRHVQVTEQEALDPDDLAAHSLQHTPGVSFTAERYRIDASVTVRPLGRPLDVWTLELSRKMVDGVLGLGYERTYGVDGRLDDQRVGLTFTIVGANQDADHDREGVNNGTSFSVR
jgi:hypothetical protein